ncbi:SECA1 [Symbiodinium sp. CCMP2592]|nr:SECA1 [Symbiodinium sp. CCMP2592]
MLEYSNGRWVLQTATNTRPSGQPRSFERYKAVAPEAERLPEGGDVTATKLATMGALLAGGARARRGRATRQVPRRLFGDLAQNLNPFYEAPEVQTKKRYTPQVEAVNAVESEMQARSDEELRELTKSLKSRAQDNQESLDSLLPEAFALVREASMRVLGLRHFDVQLMGGIALHEGNIAEMGTGEGKTLVAILAAFLNALSGKGVHVVTVNDYLARRDAEWVGQPLRFLGMSVGVVQNGMPADQKKKAYRCDVTYVTNSELGFDYLRDQMAPSPSDLSLREGSPFNFAVVDEVDSILVDEARTPLIISGVAENSPTKYQVASEVSKALRKEVHYTVDEKQRQCVLIEGGVDAAEKLLGKNDLFDPEDPWFPFITNALNAKELYIKDKAYIVKRGEVMIVDEFTGRVMEGRRWSNGLHQAIEAKENVQIQAESVTLASISYQSLFRLFDKLGGMTGTAFTEAKEFEEVYKLKTVVIPPNLSRKREDKDDQVFVDDIGKWKACAREISNAHRIGRPVLIGTTNVENSEIIAELLDALGVAYQLLNAKPENVARETEIVASSGRKYAVTIATNMAGRGTDILLGGNPTMMARLRLREELYGKLFPRKSWAMPEEFYPVDLTPELQTLVADAVAGTVEAWTPKETDLKPTSLEAAEQIVAQGRLTELEAEERLSLACEKAPTDDEAILQLREAYKALTAHYKQITDLEKEEVKALGGLMVLGTERHESRRIDNQLRGRCARQGDPGSTRFFLSLNDTIFRIFGGDNIKNMMKAMSLSQPEDTPLESGLLSNSLEEAQKKLTVLLTVLVFLAAKLGLLYLFGFQDWVTPPISDLDVPTPSSEEPVTQSAAHLEALQELRRGNAKAALAKARGCAAEHGGCRGLLGELYLTGTEVAQDLAQAMHWFQAGADLGDPDSQYALGVLYANLLEESSPELQKNEGLSILYLYAASLAGHLGAMMAMGYRHSEGLGAPRACGTAALNYIEVARRVAQVYSSGMPKAVELVRLGVDNRDRQMSLSEMAVFVEIAASGDANVAAAVGKRYLLGLEGFHQNYARAAGHLTTAAQKHHPNAMALLGYMYSLGLGVTKDLDRAYRYFHDAASRDDALGHNGLGFIHFHGTKIRAQSFDLAFRHFNVSAHAGSADGMFNLASLYLTGMGTEQSFQRAAHWYTQALDRGHTPAAYTLAVMHLNGIGAVRNCKMAVELLKRVCERGAWVSGKLREAYELQEKQSSEGAAWRFLQLAEAGHEVAQMNAAHLFDSGAASFLLNTSEGVAEPAEDRRWGRFFAQRHYELSAEQGNAFSELRLGDFAYYGWGFRLHSSAAVDGEGEDFQSEAKGAQPVDLAETLDTWQLVAQESDIDLSLAHYRRTATMRIAGEWMQPYVARAHFNLGSALSPAI